MSERGSMTNAALGIKNNMFFNDENYTNDRFADSINACNSNDNCVCPPKPESKLNLSHYGCEPKSEFANTFTVRKNCGASTSASRSYRENNKIVKKMLNPCDCCTVTNVNCCGPTRCITNRFSKTAKRKFTISKDVEYCDTFNKTQQNNSIISTNKVLNVSKSRNKRFAEKKCCDQTESESYVSDKTDCGSVSNSEYSRL